MALRICCGNEERAKKKHLSLSLSLSLFLFLQHPSWLSPATREINILWKKEIWWKYNMTKNAEPNFPGQKYINNTAAFILELSQHSSDTVQRIKDRNLKTHGGKVMVCFRWTEFSTTGSKKKSLTCGISEMKLISVHFHFSPAFMTQPNLITLSFMKNNNFT